MQDDDTKGLLITARYTAGGKLEPVAGLKEKLQKAIANLDTIPIHTMIVAHDQNDIDEIGAGSLIYEPQKGISQAQSKQALLIIKAKTIADLLEKYAINKRIRLKFTLNRLYYTASFQRLPKLSKDYAQPLQDEIQHFIHSNPSGYLLIQADGGFGKSTFMLNQIKNNYQRAVPSLIEAYHLIDNQDIRYYDPHYWLLNGLEVHLRERYKIYQDLPEVHDDASLQGRLWKLLEYVADKASKQHPCVIYLDTLDEAFGAAAPSTRSAIFQPVPPALR